MRNYNNEMLWRKSKYDEIRAHIDKNTGEKLRKKLKKEQKTIASWVRENAKKYLEP